MRWSLSEFLNLVELRSQTWCFVTLDASSGFSIPHDDTIYFYAALDGEAHLSGVPGGPCTLRAGEIVMVISGEAHALRSQSESTLSTLHFLTSGEYADEPPVFTLGQGYPMTRLLAGRLKVRWPGGQHPRAIPAVLKMRANEEVVNFSLLLERATGSGATAVLTRAASLLFVNAFREHPQCRAAFQEYSLHDPISRAKQYIQTHPFTEWSVEILAHKVGMGRSNFSTRFTEELGMPPMAFLAEERMKHAAIFLEKTDMKIAEIAQKVGYRSEAAFVRRFASAYGVSPGEWRKRNRRAVEAEASEPSSKTPPR